VEQAAAMCINPKAKSVDVALDITELWERKRQIIGQAPGLSVWKGTERIEDIGGIENAKLFCKRIVEGNDAPKTIIFIDEIEKAFAGTGTDMSGVKTELTGSMLSWMQDTEMDGTIFIGLPGVSKSNLAKAVGGTYGIPVINFDLAGMQSSLVGSSGANLRAAQKTVDAISGGRVLAIATCNSIGALPPELRRRFNLGIFFFDAPSVTERKAIWDIYRMKYQVGAGEADPNDEGWTGAEIKECCKKAYRLRMTLAEAAQYIVPVTRSSAELVRNLRIQSSGKYLSASKPGVYQYAEATEAAAKPLTLNEGGRRMRD
jgi:SpoVK/Ycf46/Vps4 family AAA+-type ATPase